MRRLAWLIVLGLALSCGESFEPASAITNLRVVAARVDIEGKPGRANPDPGDTVTITNLVIAPGADAGQDEPLTPPPLQWSLVACVPERSILPLPICQNVIPCEGCEATPPEDPLALPIVTFTVPSAEELEAAGATTVVLQGAICAEGAPASLEAIIAFVTGQTQVLNPCQDPDNEGRFISVQVIIEQDPEEPNDNPVIEDVTLNGSAWPPPFDQGVPRALPSSGCVGVLDVLGLEPYPADMLATIELTPDPSSFQPVTIDDATVIEEMQVSWLADSGGFEFSFSFISEEAGSAPIQWAPSGFPPTEGTLVRFTFPMRDIATPETSTGAPRGGVDWVERGLCVAPP